MQNANTLNHVTKNCQHNLQVPKSSPSNRRHLKSRFRKERVFDFRVLSIKRVQTGTRTGILETADLIVLAIDRFR